MSTKRDRRFAIVLSLFIAALLCPSIGRAGEGEVGDVEIGYFAGYQFLDDYDPTVGFALRPEDDFYLGVRLGYFFTPAWSLEGSYQMLETRTDPPVGSSVDFDIDSLRLNLLYNFRPGSSFRPFLTAGAGREMHDAGNVLDHSAFGYNAGGGVRWYVSPAFGLRLDGRFVSSDVGSTIDSTQSNVETSLGVLWSFGGGPPADEDADGVTDRKDKCPGTPPGATVDEAGCPKDSDGDGVWDGLDKCPGTAAGLAVDASGCPKDSDGDGVNDAIDKCPDTPRGATVDATGCPKDSDGDGVWDGIDKCPDTPRGATVDATGCPKDSDGDGVWDGIDKCPNTPRDTKVDASGCPLPAPEPPAPPPPPPPMLPEPQRPLILQGVNFAVDSAVLTVESHAVLDRVARSMLDNPSARIEIQGHTDSSASDAHNLRLSQARAESVMRYLTDKGIAASRLAAKGYGEAQPIADNRTAAGKAKNRRVELVRLE